MKLYPLFADLADRPVLVVGGGAVAERKAAALVEAGARVTVGSPTLSPLLAQWARAGRIVHIETPKTIADGAQTQHLGEYTFGIIRRDVNDIFTVSDAQLVESMRFFAERMKMVVEPTGCLAFAGACAQADRLRGSRVGVVLSGGNVDLARYAALLSDGKA